MPIFTSTIDGNGDYLTAETSRDEPVPPPMDTSRIDRTADHEIIAKQEPVNITNSKNYLESLKHTFLTKCFFIYYLEKDIKVIVDFGCADGSLIEFLKRNWPQYEYVGIEKNKEFRELARSKGITVFESAQEYNDECDVDPSCVHLNFSSVLHEIFCYDSNSEPKVITDSISPHSISVRDMLFKYNLSSSDICELTNEPGIISSAIQLEKIKQLSFYNRFMNQLLNNEKYQNKWKDYLNVESNQSKKCLAGIIEFLLKYIYDENWKREVSEKYFSTSMKNLTYRNCHHFGNYQLDFYSSYKIPYLIDRWKKDFNFKENDIILDKIDTHFNAFYTIDPKYNSRSDLIEDAAELIASYELNKLIGGYFEFERMNGIPRL